MKKGVSYAIDAIVPTVGAAIGLGTAYSLGWTSELSGSIFESDAHDYAFQIIGTTVSTFAGSILLTTTSNLVKGKLSRSLIDNFEEACVINARGVILGGISGLGLSVLTGIGLESFDLIAKDNLDEIIQYGTLLGSAIATGYYNTQVK